VRSYGMCLGVRYPHENQLQDAESAVRANNHRFGIDVCSELGCEKPKRSRGKCQTHYVAELRREKKLQQENNA
jgi:hypothetical protein